jgi:murein DD-endopeptidase MepM/ murein hydrolase activator NlpD
VVPADLPFNILISADRPVSFTLRYGGEQHEAMAQELRLELLALPGTQTVTLSARDRAGNESHHRFEIFGIPLVQPLVRAPERVVPGEPFSIRVALPPEAIAVSELRISLAEISLRVFRNDWEAVALGAVPLGSAAGEMVLTIKLTDGFNRTAVANHTLRVGDYPQPVQELNVAANILSVATPENRALEAAVVEAAYAAAKPEPVWREPFLLPIEGRHSSGFGAPRRFVRGGRVAFHHGTDIAAPVGTPIMATNRGTVVVAGFFPIRGGFVMIDHGGGVSSHYFHQAKLHVQVGDLIERGAIIGEVGSTGLSTGPHLHWEMRVGGISTDPLAWVDKMFP